MVSSIARSHRAWIFIVAFVMFFVPIAFAQTGTATKAPSKAASSKNSRIGPSAPQPNVARQKKAKANPEDPRQAIINRLYYDYYHKGCHFFKNGWYASALGQFEIATQKTVFIPLDVYDFGWDYGAAERSLGLDVRLFYKSISVPCESAALAALGRYDDATRRFEEATILIVGQYGNKPSLTGSYCEHGFAFLAAVHGRYADAEKLFARRWTNIEAIRCKKAMLLHHI